MFNRNDQWKTSITWLWRLWVISNESLYSELWVLIVNTIILLLCGITIYNRDFRISVNSKENCVVVNAKGKRSVFSPIHCVAWHWNHSTIGKSYQSINVWLDFKVTSREHFKSHKHSNKDINSWILLSTESRNSIRQWE